MLYIHPSPSHTSIFIWKYNGVTVTVNMHTNSFSHTNRYSSWAVPHMGLQNTEPNSEEVSWILQLFLYTATQELIGYRQGKPILTPEWYKKKDQEEETLYSQTHTPTHSLSTTLWDKTTHSKCSFANHYTSSNPRLFCLIWLTSVVQELSPFPSEFIMDLGPVLFF